MLTDRTMQRSIVRPARSARLVTLLLGVGILVVAVGSSFAQAVTTLTIPAVEIAVGETTAIDIDLKCAVESCSAFDIELAFDPAIARVDRAEVGSFFAEQVFPAENTVDNEIGIVQLAATTLSNSPTTGSGTLVRLTVTGLAEGSTLLYVRELGLADYDGDRIDVIEVNNTITVTSAQVAAEEAPPTPSPTATTGVSPLPAPSPTSTDVASDVLYFEDFEDNQTDIHMAGFEIVQDATGNHNFCGRGTVGGTTGILPMPSGESYSVTAKFMVTELPDSPWRVELYGRTEEMWLSGYGLSITAHEVETFSSGVVSRTALATTAIDIQAGTWYTLRLDIDGRMVGGYINELGTSTFSEMVARQGVAALRARNVEVCFDSLLVRATESAPETVAALPTPTPTFTPAPAGAGTGLLGEYYRGISFGALGRLEMSQVDPSMDFDWGESGPAAGMVDYFSIRWRGQLNAPFTETYTFTLLADDTAQLFIDDQLLIGWSPNGTRRTGSMPMVAGRRYDIRLEYYERTESARVRLEWSSPNIPRQVIPTAYLYPAEESVPAATPTLLPAANGTGLLGEYYRGINFGRFETSRIDREVIFDWGGSAPMNGLGDQFSVRWRGQIEPRLTGTHTFWTTSDDGVRLFVDNTLVIDSWVDQSMVARLGRIDLVAGRRYDITLEYYDSGGEAGVILDWSARGMLRSTIPSTQLYPADAPLPTATPRPTSTPRPTATPQPPIGFLGVMLEADFSGLTSFETAGLWRVTRQGGDTQYCTEVGDDWSLVYFGRNTWENYSVEARIQFQSEGGGHAAILTRLFQQGAGYRHAISYFPGAISHYLYQQNGGRGLGSLTTDIRAGRWYTLRAEVDGDNIRTYLNGALVLRATDDARPRGTAAIEAAPGTSVCLDDLIVRSLDRSADLVDGAAIGRITASANVRFGPGLEFPVIGGVRATDEVIILDWNEDRSWAFLRQDNGSVQGWVSADFIGGA